MQQFKHILQVRQFTVDTNHKTFTSDIQHVLGKATDMLSRGMNSIVLPHTFLNYTEIAKEQLKNPKLQQYFAARSGLTLQTFPVPGHKNLQL